MYDPPMEYLYSRDEGCSEDMEKSYQILGNQMIRKESAEVIRYPRIEHPIAVSAAASFQSHYSTIDSKRP